MQGGEPLELTTGGKDQATVRWDCHEYIPAFLHEKNT